MLSSESTFDSESLPYFKGKHVRIVAHVDKAGIKAAMKWQCKLFLEAGSRKVDIVDLSKVEVADKTKIKDLNDFLPYHSESVTKGENKWKLI
jgi:hypothetical protein